MKKEIEDLKKQLGNTTNTTNNNTTNNNTTTNNIHNINNTIVIHSFGNEQIEFSDDFLHAISDPFMGLHQKRLMLQNEIYSLRENNLLLKQI